MERGRGPRGEEMVVKVKGKERHKHRGAERNSAINATYSLKSNKCQLNSRPMVSMETLLS